MLAQCPALAHLDLGTNDIRAAGAETFANLNSIVARGLELEPGSVMTAGLIFEETRWANASL